MSESKIVTVGTAIGRDFAQLAAFALDIESAQDAIATAKSLPAPRDLTGDRLWQHLVAAGVIAYWRCFPSRPGKPSLTTWLAMPDSWAAIHEQTKHWRNHVVAHTDTMTKESSAFVLLTKADSGVTSSSAFGFSRETPVPDDVVAEFETLLSWVADRVDDLMNDLGLAVRDDLGESALADLWEQPAHEVELSDSAFVWNPTSERE